MKGSLAHGLARLRVQYVLYVRLAVALYGSACFASVGSVA